MLTNIPRDVNDFFIHINIYKMPFLYFKEIVLFVADIKRLQRDTYLLKKIKRYYCVTLFRPMTSNYLRDWLTLNVGSIMICLSSEFLLCNIYFNLDIWCVMTNTASNPSPLSHQGYQTIVFDISFKVPDFSSIRWK